MSTRPRIPFYGLALVALLYSCQEKTNGQKAADLNHANAFKTDSVNKPKVNIKVNRKYDNKGNVIAFDSTYTSYYSNVSGDTTRMDTLFNQFDRYFRSGHSALMSNEFNRLFFQDSLLYPDFFHDDFFTRRYELNDAYMKRMMQQMDSVKNRFYREESGKMSKPK